MEYAVMHYVYESACVWVECAPDDMFFTHIPEGCGVVIEGEVFHFSGHTQFVLPVTDIETLIAQGRIRKREDARGESF